MTLLGSLTMGCAFETADAGDEVRTTHAAVRVQQVLSMGGETRADALAGFVEVGPEATPDAAFSLAGLKSIVPPKGECFSESNVPGLQDLGRASSSQLLAADSVRLVTDLGNHELAPYAFPSVGDLPSGVVYQSRDRSSDTLPADADYRLEGRGVDDARGAVNLSSVHASPPHVSGVTLNGIELSESATLPPADVVDLTWRTSGDDTDLVVVTWDTQAASWTCTFSDKEEFGSVPLVTDDGEKLGAPGVAAVVGLHRVRIVPAIADDGETPVTITFDFATEAGVTFDAPSNDSE